MGGWVGRREDGWVGECIAGRSMEWADILVEKEEDGQKNDGGMDEIVGDGQMDGKILK